MVVVVVGVVVVVVVVYSVKSDICGPPQPNSYGTKGVSCSLLAGSGRDTRPAEARKHEVSQCEAWASEGRTCCAPITVIEFCLRRFCGDLDMCLKSILECCGDFRRSVEKNEQRP